MALLECTDNKSPGDSSSPPGLLLRGLLTPLQLLPGPVNHLFSWDALFPLLSPQNPIPINFCPRKGNPNIIVFNFCGVFLLFGKNFPRCGFVVHPRATWVSAGLPPCTTPGLRLNSCSISQICSDVFVQSVDLLKASECISHSFIIIREVLILTLSIFIAL